MLVRSTIFIIFIFCLKGQFSQCSRAPTVSKRGNFRRLSAKFNHSTVVLTVLQPKYNTWKPQNIVFEERGSLTAIKNLDNNIIISSAGKCIEVRTYGINCICTQHSNLPTSSLLQNSYTVIISYLTKQKAVHHHTKHTGSNASQYKGKKITQASDLVNHHSIN